MFFSYNIKSLTFGVDEQSMINNRINFTNFNFYTYNNE